MKKIIILLTVILSLGSLAQPSFATQAEYRAGYRDGYIDGKSMSSQVPMYDEPWDYQRGYRDGYYKGEFEAVNEMNGQNPYGNNAVYYN